MFTERIPLASTSLPAISLVMAQPYDAAADRVCFLSHGLNAAATAPHISKIMQAYLHNGYTVIAPDLPNSDHNRSAGTLKNFTIADHINGVRRTIEWARHNAGRIGWDNQFFVMAGHSMGSYASCYLAAREFPQNCRHLLAVSPTTSGERSLKARNNKQNHPDGMEILRRNTPWLEAEWPQHDIYKDIHLLKMPVSVAVGAIDTLTLPSDIHDFCRALPLCIEEQIIPGKHHSLDGNSDPITPLLATMVRRLDIAAGLTRRPGQAPAMTL